MIEKYLNLMLTAEEKGNLDYPYKCAEQSLILNYCSRSLKFFARPQK